MKGTDEQTLSPCIPGDQVDGFNPTVSFLKPPKLSFPLLLSPGLITVMLSLGSP